MAFATPSDLVARFDERIVRDLASDSGDPIARQQVATNAVLLAALADAQGRIVSAVTVARHYSEEDLEALTGSSAALLTRLTCELAMAYLLRRRQEKYADEQYQRLREDAEDYLDRLRKGERLFGLDANLDAGLPTIDGPTATTYQRLNMLPDRVHNYYPHRVTRLPIGREG